MPFAIERDYGNRKLVRIQEAEREEILRTRYEQMRDAIEKTGMPGSGVFLMLDGKLLEGCRASGWSASRGKVLIKFPPKKKTNAA